MLARNDSEARFERAVRALHTAEILREANRLPEAERECRQAIALLEKLVSGSPEPRGYRRELATAHDTMGQIDVASGERDRAEAAYKQVIRLCSEMLAEDQGDALVRWRMAACLNRLAPLQRADGRWIAAKRTLERGRELVADRGGRRPVDPRVERECVSLSSQLGRLNLEMGLWADAVESLETAARVQAKLVERSCLPNDRELLAGLLTEQARVHAALVRPAEAERALAAALEIAEGLATEFASRRNIKTWSRQSSIS